MVWHQLFSMFSDDSEPEPTEGLEFSSSEEEGDKKKPHEAVDGGAVSAVNKDAEAYQAEETILGADAPNMSEPALVNMGYTNQELAFQLAAIVQASDDGIFSKTLDGVITSWNKGAEAMYGYTPAEIVGQNVSILFPAHLSDELDQLMSKVRQGHSITQYETTRLTKSGHHIEVSITISPVLDEVGQVQSISVVARDVSATKKIKNKLGAIVNSAVDGIIMIDQEGIIEYSNPSVEVMFGYRQDELLGRNVKMLMPEPYSGEHDEYLQRYLRTGVKKIIGTGRQVLAKRKDESTFPVELTISEVDLGDGRRAFTGIIRDISELKQAYQMLEHKQYENEMIINTMPAMVFYKDANNKIVRLNQHAAESMGGRIEDFEGKQTEDLFPEMAEKYLQDDLEVINSGQPKLGIVEEYMPLDGQLRWVRTDKVPQYDEHGNAIGVLAMALDVTATEQLRDQLEESDQRFNMALSAAGVGIWDLNLETGKAIWNEQLHTVFGIPPGTFGGSFEAFIEMVHPDDRDRMKKASQRSIEWDDPYYQEFRILHPDSQYRFLASRGNVYRDEEGRAIRMAGACWDITESKLSELAEKRHRLMLENVLQGVSELDKDGKYVYVNEAYAQMVGRSQSELLTLGWQVTVAPESIDELKSAFSQMIKDGRSETIAKGLRADGTEFYKHVVMVAKHDEEGHYAGNYCFMRDVTQETELKNQLNEVAQKFQAIFNQTYQFVGLMTPDGVLIEANETACNNSGVKLEEVLNKPFWETPWWSHSPALQNRLKDAVKQARNGEFVRFEATHPTPDGSLICVDFSLKPVKDELGNVVLLIPEGRDITYFKETQDSLQHYTSLLEKSEERFNLAIEGASDGIWDWDIAENNVYYSPRFKELMGYKDAEMGNEFSDWFDKVHPDDQPLVERAIAEHLEGKQAVYAIEYRLLCKSCEYKWFYAKGKAVFDHYGKPYRMSGSLSDISHQKETEEALIRNNGLTQMLNYIISMAADGAASVEEIIELCINSVCQYQNWPVGHAYHYDSTQQDLAPMGLWHVEDEAEFADFKDITSKTRFESGEGLPGRVFKSKAPCWIFNVNEDENFPRNRRKELLGVKAAFAFPIIIDQRVEVVLEFFSRNEETPDDQLLEILATLGSQVGRVIERKQTEAALIIAKEQAEKAAKAKSQFLATMSHEIRTPMNAVIGMAQLLEQTQLNTRQRDYVHNLKVGSDSLLSIINDILDFSRFESGRIQLESRAFSVKQSIEDVFSLLPQSLFLDKDVAIHFEIDPEVPKAIVSDEARLRQVLLNLLNNAMKFTHKGSVTLYVTVSNEFEQSPDQIGLQFSVKDTGIGIEKDKQQQLFQAFTQADSSTARKYGGTGLGLSISKYIAEAFGGRIWVDSEVDKGSTFSFTIQTKPADNVITDDLAIRALEGLPVLIVDGDDQRREQLLFHCQELKMKPMATEWPGEAMTWAHRGDTFEVVLVNNDGKGMSGLEFAEAIRAVPAMADCKLLLLGPCDQWSAYEKTYKGLFDGLLENPTRLASLRECLFNQLDLDALGAGVNQGDGNAAKYGRRKDDLLGEQAPLTILVAEDNSMNQRVIESSLNLLGYEPDLVDSGLKALEAVKTKTYDLILMDIQMPEMDGIEATTRILADTSLEKTPVIVALTANVLQESQDEYKAVGFHDFLGKPFELDELKQLIQRASLRSQNSSDVSGTAMPKSEGGMVLIEPGDSLVNFAKVQELTGFTNQDLKGFYRDFLRECPIEKLSQAIDARDEEAISKAAHELKGVFGLFQIPALEALATEIEEEIKHHSSDEFEETPNLKALQTQLQAQYQQACDDIEVFLAN